MPGVSLALIDIDGNLKTKTLALVDSGCDFSTFPVEWAKELGIDIDDDCLETEGGTAGGMADRFLYEPGIAASFLGRKHHLAATFAPECPLILLGREDFFRYYTVTFDQPELTFALKAEAAWDAADQAAQEAIEELAESARAEVAAKVAAAA